MEEIKNHNCAGFCCEKYCDNVETQFIQLDFNGLIMLVEFCEKHAQEFETKLREDQEKMAEDWRTLCKSKLME